ncbi:hypothetical protein AB0R11_19260 [Streptomyces fradiae]|uniref:hypothetical protein n=1 Tax=Streptomyces fradiae TaxID=1906 RepID=UPI00343FDFB0
MVEGPASAGAAVTSAARVRLFASLTVASGFGASGHFAEPGCAYAAQAGSWTRWRREP